MSFRVTRIPAMETGPWDKKRNKATVVLPGDAGIVDLDSTRLMLRTRATCDMMINGARVEDVPYPVGFGSCNGSRVARSAHCLVKNVNSRSSELGILLPARPYQNILTNAIEAYTRSRSGMRNDTLFGRHVSKYYNNDVFSDMEGSIFFYGPRPLEPNFLVEQKAQWVTPEIAVPMSCLDSRARGMRQFPCAVFGDTTYSVEFEDRLTLITDVDEVPDIPCDDVNPVQRGEGWYIGVLPAGGDAGSPIILTDITQIDRIALWVGQYVTITCTPAGGAQIERDVKITSLKFNTENNVRRAEVTIENPGQGDGLLIPEGNVAVGGITLAWVTPIQGSLAWSIEDINLEPIQAVLPPKALQDILAVPMGPNGMDLPYYDYEHFQFNVPQTNVYNCTINVGPGCIGMFATFLADDSLEGKWNNVGDYAYTINGTSTTDGYKVLVGYEGNCDFANQVNRQLHNTRLKQFFKNIGIPLRKYDVPINSLVNDPDRQTASNAIFPQIIPNVPVPQVVQLTLRVADGAEAILANTLDIFVMYKRTEQIRGGKVTIVNG